MKEDMLEIFPTLKLLENPEVPLKILSLAREGRVTEAMNVEGRKGEVFAEALKWKVALDYKYRGAHPTPPRSDELMRLRRKRYFNSLQVLLMIQELKTIGGEMGLLQSNSLKDIARREGEKILKLLDSGDLEDPFLSADKLLGELKFLRGISPQKTLDSVEAIRKYAEDPYHFPLLALEGGDILLILDMPERACELTEEGATLAGRVGNKWLRGQLLLLSAEAHEQMGDMREAEAQLTHARECFQLDQRRKAMALVDLKRALLLIREGRLKEAREVLKTPTRIIRKIGDLQERSYLASVHTLYTFRSSTSRRRKKRVLMTTIESLPVKENPEAYNVLREAVEGEEWMREDPDTSVLFESPEEVTISRDVARMIMESARETYPNEFGALLIGYPHIHSLQPIVDAARGNRSFIFSFWDRFSGKALVADGMVHSHPSGVAKPSRADLYMFSRFRVNLIIGYPFTEDSIAAYDSVGNRIEFRIVKNGGTEEGKR